MPTTIPIGSYCVIAAKIGVAVARMECNEIRDRVVGAICLALHPPNVGLWVMLDGSHWAGWSGMDMNAIESPPFPHATKHRAFQGTLYSNISCIEFLMSSPLISNKPNVTELNVIAVVDDSPSSVA